MIGHKRLTYYHKENRGAKIGDTPNQPYRELNGELVTKTMQESPPSPDDYF